MHWTVHSKQKMRHYGLSEARVRRIMHSPSRVEEGIAPNTQAMMQKAGSLKHPHELWVMMEVRKRGNTVNVISAWRYPGITKPRSVLTLNILKSQYQDYVDRAAREMEAEDEKKAEFRAKFRSAKWFKKAV